MSSTERTCWKYPQPDPIQGVALSSWFPFLPLIFICSEWCNSAHPWRKTCSTDYNSDFHGTSRRQCRVFNTCRYAVHNLVLFHFHFYFWLMVRIARAYSITDRIKPWYKRARWRCSQFTFYPTKSTGPQPSHAKPSCLYFTSAAPSMSSPAYAYNSPFYGVCFYTHSYTIRVPVLEILLEERTQVDFLCNSPCLPREEPPVILGSWVIFLCFCLKFAHGWLDFSICLHNG